MRKWMAGVAVGAALVSTQAVAAEVKIDAWLETADRRLITHQVP
jgi:hypothetical protein